MRPKIRIDFWTIVFFAFLLAAGVYYGDQSTVILLLLALVLHETAHILFAELFGYWVGEFKLTPLGGRLVIDSLMALHPVAEFVIAAAGPFSNFLMAAGVWYLGLLGFKNVWLENWRQLNLLLGVVNLIPAVPLDGGRILHALIKKIVPVETAMFIMKLAGQFIGGLFLSIGIIKFWNGHSGILYIVTGIFLTYQVFTYPDPKLDGFWRMSEKRKKIFREKGYAALKPVLVKPDTLIRNILQRYGGNEWLLFAINGAGKTDLITEEAAWDLLINRGYDATFQDLKGFSSSLPK